MQVICTDGTTFHCESYELNDYGAVLYGQELNENKDRYEEDPEQFAYIPHARLWYILPDGVRSHFPGLPNAGQQPQQVPQQQPPVGAMPQSPNPPQ